MVQHRKRVKKMHIEENSTSQIFRSDAFSWKTEMTNEVFWCVWQRSDPAGDSAGFQTFSDMGSGLLKMVTAAEADNLTGSIYIWKD